jgi:DNA replication protein DnaC
MAITWNDKRRATGPVPLRQILNGKTDSLRASMLLEAENPVCEFCGQEILPQLFDEAGQEVTDREQATYVIPREFCTCPSGRAAKAKHEQILDQQNWLDQARQIITTLETGLYQHFRFSSWDSARYPGAAQIKQAVSLYVADIVSDRTRRWLYLHGSYGLGKTHLAVAAARQIAAEKLWRPMVAVWPQHCSSVQESWSRDNGEAGPSESQLWGSMRGADLLLLDDIDKTDSNQWSIQKLFEVIDYRVVRKKTTIITANHSLEALRDLWLGSKKEHIRDTGSAILSRIAGELHSTIGFTGEDQRWTK